MSKLIALFVVGALVGCSTSTSRPGHTLGACGAIEAWVTLNMMREGWYHPTMNLENVDPECATLDYIGGEPRSLRCEHIISNNFAFGGVNTSLVFRQ
jgi:3-oxoacyl-[acyl-carrier-protein] synthase II